MVVRLKLLRLDMPRDRDGTFEHKLIGKRQTTLGEGLDNRILSLYSNQAAGAVAVDLKPIYQVSTLLASAEQKLTAFADKWAGRPVPAKLHQKIIVRKKEELF